MKLEIEVTEEQAAFLKQFARNQYAGARDNVCTNKPLHLVQSKVLRCIYDGGGNGDYDIYINTDDDELESFADARSVVMKYGKYDDPSEVLDYETAFEEAVVNDKVIFDEEDYFKAYGVTLHIEKCSVIIDYETRAYFFILENAKKYLEYQGHNLNEPRTYTAYFGYGNKGEYEPFYDLLMSIGDQLLGGDGE